MTQRPRQRARNPLPAFPLPSGEPGGRVEAEEPAPADEPLFTLDNVIVAPHALCWTDECFAGNGAADVAAMKALMKGEAPEGVVNRAVLDSARFRERLAAFSK